MSGRRKGRRAGRRKVFPVARRLFGLLLVRGLTTDSRRVGSAVPRAVGSSTRCQASVCSCFGGSRRDRLRSAREAPGEVLAVHSAAECGIPEKFADNYRVSGVANDLGSTSHETVKNHLRREDPWFGEWHSIRTPSFGLHATDRPVVAAVLSPSLVVPEVLMARSPNPSPEPKRAIRHVEQAVAGADRDGFKRVLVVNSVLFVPVIRLSGMHWAGGSRESRSA